LNKCPFLPFFQLSKNKIYNGDIKRAEYNSKEKVGTMPCKRHKRFSVACRDCKDTLEYKITKC